MTLCIFTYLLLNRAEGQKHREKDRRRAVMWTKTINQLKMVEKGKSKHTKVKAAPDEEEGQMMVIRSTFYMKVMSDDTSNQGR